MQLVDISTLKAKSNITRQDVADLLRSIGAPGKKREEKVAAVRQLELKNSQGHDVSDTLDSYQEW